jgi:hypothetical protein
MPGHEIFFFWALDSGPCPGMLKNIEKNVEKNVKEMFKK